ncbi:MAG: lysophospholipase [Solirubrobacteraceae bacterium MAG38_C4-C5]|nr:lysophospholipase [Candidatus Siliceabacter maunaloa]
MPAGYRPDDALLPAELARRDGLAYALFLPESPPSAGLVVLHGADSAKESHYDFARLAAASGPAALCFDLRGHGDSEGALGAGALSDVAAMAGRVREACGGGPVALRGSSMGGWLALCAAQTARAAAVVAICPATGSGLRRGVREGRFAFHADADGFEALAGEHDELAAAAALGERLLLLHAEGDEQVPVTVSAELHAAAPGSRFIRVPGGHHRSIQHDGELQAASLRWLLCGLVNSSS